MIFLFLFQTGKSPREVPTLSPARGGPAGMRGSENSRDGGGGKRSRGLHPGSLTPGIRGRGKELSNSAFRLLLEGEKME